jgi:hypothetical protein
LVAFSAGVAAVVIPALLLAAAGWFNFIPSAGSAWLHATLGSLLFLLPAAAAEELLVHGYLFAVLRSRFGARAALVATSIAFGLLHLANPGAGVQPVLVVIAAGFFIGTVFLWTGSLPAAIMLHLGWNWALVGILHARVSGLAFETPGYRLEETGPDLVTGRGWGPEGGMGAVSGMLLGLWLLSRLKRK